MDPMHLYLPLADAPGQFEVAQEVTKTQDIIVHANGTDRAIVTSIAQGTTPGGTATHTGMWHFARFTCGGAGEWHILSGDDTHWTFT